MGFISRFRHTRGFGIHSPFAYRFITEVLTEKLPYYDYHALKNYTQTLIYRVALYFQPTGIVSLGQGDIIPAKMACPKAMVKGYFGDHDELAVAGIYAKSTDLAKAIDSHAPIIAVITPRNVIADAKKRLDNLGFGMVFDNCRDMVVIVPDPKLPRQNIDLNF